MTLLERDREKIEEGREEGREEGIKEGRLVGKEEERLEIAKNMKELGIDIDIIIKSTKLNRDEVLNI